MEDRFILIHKRITGDKIVSSFNATCLNDVLRHIGWWLSGCSFVLDKYARLQFIELKTFKEESEYEPIAKKRSTTKRRSKKL